MEHTDRQIVVYLTDKWTHSYSCVFDQLMLQLNRWNHKVSVVMQRGSGSLLYIKVSYTDGWIAVNCSNSFMSWVSKKIGFASCNVCVLLVRKKLADKSFNWRFKLKLLNNLAMFAYLICFNSLQIQHTNNWIITILV